MKHKLFNLSAVSYEDRRSYFMLALMTFAVFFGLNDMALADTTGTLSTVTDATDSIWDTANAILRPVSLLAIVILGILGGFGKMEWGTIFKVFIGITIANSAVTIVDWMSAGTTAT